MMTRKRKCHSKSNSFVAAAEQVCLQPVLEHRQRRGRRNITWQAIPQNSLQVLLLLWLIKYLSIYLSTPLLQQQERHDLQ